MLLTARSADQLEQLSVQLSSKGVSVASAAIDLTKPDGIAAAMAGLLQQGETPSVLINNAGAAYTGDLLAMPIERHLDQLLSLSEQQLREARYSKFRAMGRFLEKTSQDVEKAA